MAGSLAWVPSLYADLVALAPPRPAGAPPLEAEERSVPLPPLPPSAENYYADLLGHRNADARAWLQLLADDETRRGLLPAAPNAFDDWDWSNWFGLASVKPGNEPEWSAFTPSALPPVPFVFPDDDAGRQWGLPGLAALVAVDEFVNAPSGGTVFGPAPKGRSARFGFSISVFR